MDTAAVVSKIVFTVLSVLMAFLGFYYSRRLAKTPQTDIEFNMFD